MTRKLAKKQTARLLAKKKRAAPKKRAARRRAPAKPRRKRGDLIPEVEEMIGLDPPEIVPVADQESSKPPPAAPAAPTRPTCSARCAIVLPAFLRATTRALRRQLDDASSGLAVVVVVPAPGWIEPVKALFVAKFRPRWEVVTDANNKTPQHKSDRNREIAIDLSRRKSTVGFATNAEALPSVLTASADLTIRMQALDGATIMASGLPDNVPATTGGDGDGDLPVPVQKASAHASVYDDAGSACVSRYRHRPCCLLWDGKHQHPELVLRRSIPRLRPPL